MKVFLVRDQVSPVSLQHCGQVLLAHLVPAEGPVVLLVNVRVDMLLAVCVPPVVPHPHIIALV